MPTVLADTSMRPDSRLTRMEGAVGLSLVAAGIDVSLIPGPHGTYGYGTYAVGLHYPALTAKDGGNYPGVDVLQSFTRYT